MRPSQFSRKSSDSWQLGLHSVTKRGLANDGGQVKQSAGTPYPKKLKIFQRSIPAGADSSGKASALRTDDICQVLSKSDPVRAGGQVELPALSPKVVRATKFSEGLELPAWTRVLPERLQSRLTFSFSTSFSLPKQPFILVLYAGIDDATSLEAALHSVDPTLTKQVVAFDIKRSKSHDLLLEEPWNSLCTAAVQGLIWAIVGGPNCKTWSIRRHFRRPVGQPQAYPVRGRSEPECWGLMDNSPGKQNEVDDDSVLLLRQMRLIDLMHKKLAWAVHLLEHPADPAICCDHPAAKTCSSIWVTEVIRSWRQAVPGTLLTFDQCRLGQVVAKTTTAHTNLDLAWDNMRCNHGKHTAEVPDSAELSRWPWQMMLDISAALVSGKP